MYLYEVVYDMVIDINSTTKSTNYTFCRHKTTIELLKCIEQHVETQARVSGMNADAKNEVILKIGDGAYCVMIDTPRRQ